MYVGALAQRVSVGGRPLPRLTQQQRVARLVSPQLINLQRFSLPSKYVVESYPGRPMPRKDDFRHRLYQLFRFSFLHLLSRLSSRHRRFLADTLDPRSNHNLKLNDGRTVADLKLYGPKVLAAPDRLSMTEYASLAPWLDVFAQACLTWDDSMFWLAMDQVWQQCALCPELLDYVHE